MTDMKCNSVGFGVAFIVAGAVLLAPLSASAAPSSGDGQQYPVYIVGYAGGTYDGQPATQYDQTSTDEKSGALDTATGVPWEAHAGWYDGQPQEEYDQLNAGKAAYEADLAAQLCEVKPWVFCVN